MGLLLQSRLALVELSEVRLLRVAMVRIVFFQHLQLSAEAEAALQTGQQAEVVAVPAAQAVALEERQQAGKVQRVELED